MSWLVIGDFGQIDNDGSKSVAVKMESIACNERIDFVLNTGNSFHYPDEVIEIDADAFDTDWLNVFKSTKYLKPIPWYSVLGNLDYNNDGLETYLTYSKNGWNL